MNVASELPQCFVSTTEFIYNETNDVVTGGGGGREVQVITGFPKNVLV